MTAPYTGAPLTALRAWICWHSLRLRLRLLHLELSSLSDERLARLQPLLSIFRAFFMDPSVLCNGQRGSHKERHTRTIITKSMFW
jgi:hypothetical protein